MWNLSHYFFKGDGVLLNFQKKLKINGHAILWNNFYVNKEYLKKKGSSSMIGWRIKLNS